VRESKDGVSTVKVIVLAFSPVLNIENYLGFDLKDGRCKIFGKRF